MDDGHRQSHRSEEPMWYNQFITGPVLDLLVLEVVLPITLGLVGLMAGRRLGHKSL